MTPREILARVRAHLLAQGRRAVDDPDGADPSCVYRGAGGLRCAVGCLVPDDLYSPGMEGVTVTALVTAGGRWGTTARGSYREPLILLAGALNGAGVPATEGTRELLLELQGVHDGDEPGSWEAALDRIAARLPVGP